MVETDCVGRSIAGGSREFSRCGAEWPWSYLFFAIVMFFFVLHAAGRSLGLDAWLRRGTATFCEQPTVVRLLGLELRRFDDIAEALVVAAHANAELLRTFFQGLQTALGQAALDVRIVLHRMNVPRERGDHGRGRPFRGDDPKPRGEFIVRQTGLGRRWQPRSRLEPL